MSLRQRALVWIVLVVAAAIVLGGVEPFGPALLAIVLIVAFEVAQRRLWPRR